MISTTVIITATTSMSTQLQRRLRLEDLAPGQGCGECTRDGVPGCVPEGSRFQVFMLNSFTHSFPLLNKKPSGQTIKSLPLQHSVVSYPSRGQMARSQKGRQWAPFVSCVPGLLFFTPT